MIFFTPLNFKFQLEAKILNLIWNTVVIRIVVDYIAESLWEVNG